MAEILAVKSLCGCGGGVVVSGFQCIAWSQPQSGLAVTILSAMNQKTRKCHRDEF